MRPLALMLAAFALFACGSAPPSTPGLPPAVPSLPGITDGDDGHTFTIHVGEEVEVTLHRPAGFDKWGQPMSSNPAVLTPIVDTRAAAVQGATLARFKAMSSGRAEINAATSAQCPPNTACVALARVWKVTVVVV